MSDISVSERRLSAALDRIDHLLEVGLRRPAAAATLQEEAEPASMLQARIADLESENTRLAGELGALRTDRGGPLEAALAEARARLTAAGQQAARLSAANDDLAAANRRLIEAASGVDAPEDAGRAALEAEIEALRAARAAEIAQMGDIMIELERLLADEPSADRARIATRAGDDAVLPEVTGDVAGVPEDETGDDDHSPDGPRGPQGVEVRDGDR
ncbi:hypothetical protein [Paracoccus salsus]|uniref:hypothetical protein n=1 Tax=Paracoccus salsus TaxID=2911061 RepID=UPI001F412E68|nr:hypothetical protein [Paracoccus salsus]MCF3974877.1 hypothetical protein [Paracoccus salsus]